MKRLRIVTQTDAIERGKPGTTSDDWMDDCAPSSLAAVNEYLTGIRRSSRDGMAWVAKAGRKDRDGFGDPTTFEQINRAAKTNGMRVTWAKSWKQVLDALAREDRALLISVDQPKNYPASVPLSKWARAHKKRTGGKPYGHLTAAVGGPRGAQWADPTMSGKGAEAYAVDITTDELRAILASKNPGKPWLGARIVSLVAPIAPPPAPARLEPVAPPAPTAPATPAPAAPAPTPTPAAISVRERLSALRARILGFRRGPR
jgi:hypothetical protein